MQTLHGTLLQPVSASECRITPDYIVRIDDAGRIAEVGTGATSAGDVLGGNGCWILPGFVDGHLHLPQWDRRGLDGLPLFDWHEQIVYPAEARFADPSFGEALAEDFVSGMIANGTTTVSAFGSPFAEATERVFEVFDRRGIRAIYGLMLKRHQLPYRTER